jgi:hypothetical protein
MARVVGPLYSVTASGTLGKNLTFLPGVTTHTVRFKPSRPLNRTTAQQLHGARVADCRASWRQQSPATRTDWSARAVFMHLTGPALWFREWFSQNIYPPSTPAIPA